MGYPIANRPPPMDYLLAALAGFVSGACVNAWAGRRRKHREEMRRHDGAILQADAFLRGIKAFERGVAAQIERDRQAAGLRRLTGQRNRIL